MIRTMAANGRATKPPRLLPEDEPAIKDPQKRARALRWLADWSTGPNGPRSLEGHRTHSNGSHSSR